MSLLSLTQWNVAQAIAAVGHTNPFSSERAELERRILGDRYQSRPVIQYRAEFTMPEMFPNADAMLTLAEELAESIRGRLIAGATASGSELLVYEDISLYVLYSRYLGAFEGPVQQYLEQPEGELRIDFFDDFKRDFAHYLRLPNRRLPSGYDECFVMAALFQIDRAFYYTFRYIVGGSTPAAKLRADIWQSVFTHDMRRYSRSLYRVMGNVTTLVTGPTGTGKELVARAIAHSRFIEFDSKRRCFLADLSRCFHGINLSALPPTLIESELFGHIKGAYSGAHRDHDGYLDENVCRRSDTVFLDEIGEVDQLIQVKLLRVLQSREFRRVGDVATRRFHGKIVAATNRDLSREMAEGRFREDFYYRLCADQITTPSLHEQLRASPDDLLNCVRFTAQRLLPGFDDEVERLTSDVMAWIDRELGADYLWPGNFRELEQCVRSVMIRGAYYPARSTSSAASSTHATLLSDVADGRLTRDQLLQRYFSIVYAKTGSYRGAAKRLGVDWRTVQRIVEHASDGNG